MRLKHLELQGYKTFASRTDFAFESGITAIVGPNGSGKSNIADAIRWVLGEQSYRTLRGKKTEDMIFSGSAQRARLGMASASLTMDNVDNWLPIDFAEVTIARRAYRSGENEYLLNGSRVRLRDITELLAKSGLAQRTYTVVGQGLVDAVLSLRAEDRRALFEEAAGITLYQSKRADALARLEETRANLLRVNDIVNEIAPRLRRLEREAERANHHHLLSSQLEGLLRTWYGFRWRQEQQNLQRARDSLARREVRVERRRADLDELDAQMVALRTRQAQLREQLGAWQQERGQLQGQRQSVQQDLAVWHERDRLLTRQRDDLEAELVDLEVRARSEAERVSALEAELNTLHESLQAADATVTQAQAALDTHESSRDALAGRLADAQSRAFDLATRAADRRNRLAQLEERRAALAAEQSEHLSILSNLEQRAGEVQARTEAVNEQLTHLRGQREGLQTEAGRLEDALNAALGRLNERRDVLVEAERAQERLQSRMELLSRLREEGEGFHAGVRAVLQAASPENRLSGIIGTVAQLLQVPEEVEVAIEVALGGHLQDVVVDSWRAAERAIDFLRSDRLGRATFLPLDTVRAMQRLEMPEVEGIVGVAADLVHAEERLAGIQEMLLGRTIVARDLKAARRAFERLKGGFQIVTLAGDVLRSSGAVTGGEGKGQSRGQVLSREREWRGMPGQLSAAEKHCQHLRGLLEDEQAALLRMREEAASLETELEQAAEAVTQVLEQARGLERETDEVARQTTWRQDLMSQLDTQMTEAEAAQSSLKDELERLLVEGQSAEDNVAALQAELEGFSGEALYRRLSEARTGAAVARGRLEHRQAALDGVRERQTQVEVEMATKRERVGQLDQEKQALAKQVGGHSSRQAVIDGWLVSLGQKIEPAEVEVEQLDMDREALEREESSLRAHLREAESGYSQALLSLNRQEDRLDRLRRQITDDFGLVEMEPTEGMPEQPPLPLGELVSALPHVLVLPEGLEDEIHQIKAQVRRMGAVNPNAPEEYAETLDRYTFLTSQAADLEEAARSLREVIAELDEVMRREFHVVFAKVAERFRENFAQLFGGGTAQLILTEPDNVSLTGVEIVARPPGKRQQTLALLSGGERSLTAVALIFALLEISPPPFCILDEVDAMLDEANIRRFRSALEALAEHTQFIVITHNRGTIQAADTIYGVSMGDDSVSQVVSLRLEGERIAAPDGSEIDVAKEG